ncbi:MAG: radical SAM protein [Nitrospinaceae bacterium]|nr:radical SAM protein [Nitrospinaceae bacterium]NIR54394.1 radical SAM protein [Nitrospinaceae bacterium]NIS84808.1 radical SAM protein [Nitrospinaceae bacterium]NIT81613.1 radical SAM protein [Nitrospinaceae bacterium]NIU43896.1 radical SAM protein [Nitrospinaceae bacterium]
MIYRPDVIYIESDAAEAPLTRRVRERFPQTPVIMQPSLEAVMAEIRQTAADVFGAAKQRLHLARFKGPFLKKCPGISPGMVCCNYYVVNLIKNCIYDCSYCFLQDFLDNNPLMTAFVNVDDLLAELDEVFSANPDHTFRVGTGELTDSLALDEVLPYSQTLLPFFNARPNAVLELKTKSDRVANLLSHPDPTNIIVSWSLNPAEIAACEEWGAPAIAQRLAAARQCAEKGYRIGFHFDPVILFPGWENAYAGLIHTMLESVPPNRIEWISLGGFRYRPHLKKVIKERHPRTRLFTQEHLPGEDGKFRYLRPLRKHAFETLRRMIKDRSQELNVYLCMETSEIWQGVTGKMPRADKQLDAFFDL